MRWSYLFIAIAIAALLAGCKPGKPVKPDNVGGVRRPKEYRAVVSLSPSTTELLGAIQLSTDRFKGRTSSCNFPDYFTAKTPIVMDQTKPIAEKLASIKPDMIVYDGFLHKKEDLQQYETAGATLVEMKVTTIAEYSQFILQLSKLLGGESTASSLVDKLVAVGENAKAANLPRKPKVAILTGEGAGEYYIAGVDSFQADVVRYAQGEPVGPKANNFVTASIESVVAENPEFIFSDKGAAAILKDPRLASVAAVKLGQVYNVNEDILLRAGSRVGDLVKAYNRYFQEAFSTGKLK